jgi:hypothetical protein
MRSDSLRELASHGLGGSESIDSVAEGGFDWLGSASPGIGAVYASIKIAKLRPSNTEL